MQHGVRARYLPLQLQAGLRGTEQGEIRGVRVGSRLQGLNQSGGGAQGTGADDVDLPHPEPGDNREDMCEALHDSRCVENQYRCCTLRAAAAQVIEAGEV